MGWFTACVLYALIWWTVLFAVLPLGVTPIPQADENSGWRGTPREAGMARKLLLTTLLATIFWLAAVVLIEGTWLSFRRGILAMPTDYS